jgi:Flp pilus assembly protein TadD
VASRVLSAEPDNTEALIILAVSQGKQNQWQAAAATLDRARQTAPREPTILCLLGVVRQHQGNADQANAYFTEALKLNPQDTWAKELLASSASAAAPANP